MHRSDVAWMVLIAWSSLLAGAFVLMDIAYVIRPAAVLWFLAVCPGMAYVRLLRLRNPVQEWTLAIALSLSLDGIVSSALVYSGMWSPKLALVLLLALTAVSVLGVWKVGSRVAEPSTPRTVDRSSSLRLLPLGRWQESLAIVGLIGGLVASYAGAGPLSVLGVSAVLLGLVLLIETECARIYYGTATHSGVAVMRATPWPLLLVLLATLMWRFLTVVRLLP